MATHRWRYNVVVLKPTSMFRTTVGASVLQAELDRQGTQGWELVSILPIAYPASTKLVFKRPA